jgi:hypothetical protein
MDAYLYAILVFFILVHKSIVGCCKLQLDPFQTSKAKYSLRSKIVVVLALDFYVYNQLDKDKPRHKYKTHTLSNTLLNIV